MSESRSEQSPGGFVPREVRRESEGIVGVGPVKWVRGERRCTVTIYGRVRPRNERTEWKSASLIFAWNKGRQEAVRLDNEGLLRSDELFKEVKDVVREKFLESFQILSF